MIVIALIDAVKFDRTLFSDAVQTYFKDAQVEIFGGPDRTAAAQSIRAAGHQDIDLVVVDIARGHDFNLETIELIDTLCRYGQGSRLLLTTPKDRIDRAVELELMADRPFLQRLAKPWPVKQLLDEVEAAIERTQRLRHRQIQVGQLAP